MVQLRLRTNLINNRACLATQSRRFQNIVASGALATTLFLVTILNFALSSQSETKINQARGIASAAPMIDNELAQWNKSLLKKMAQQTERKMASISAKATDMDQLRFGLLEGKYALKLEDGKISEIVFQDTVGSDERPKYINSKDEFLSQYKSLLKSEFTTASRISEKVDNGSIIESYQLMGPTSSPVALAKFTSDQYGRLISFRIERE